MKKICPVCSIEHESGYDDLLCEKCGATPPQNAKHDPRNVTFDDGTVVRVQFAPFPPFDRDDDRVLKFRHRVTPQDPTKSILITIEYEGDEQGRLAHGEFTARDALMALIIHGYQDQAAAVDELNSRIANFKATIHD